MKDLDPELAALLEDLPVAPSPSVLKSNIFPPTQKSEEEPITDPNAADLTLTSFEKVDLFYEQAGHKYFDDKHYYKKVLGNENQTAQRLHNVLTKYLTCQDPKDRTVYRQQLITAYWDFAAALSFKIGSDLAEIQKRLTFRFALLLPNLLSPEQKQLFSTVIYEKKTREAVFYIDEWLNEIGKGNISSSTTDEVKTKRSDDSARFQQLLSKAEGKRQNITTLMIAKSNEKTNVESGIKNKLDSVFNHMLLSGFTNVHIPYSENQKKILVDIVDSIKTLLNQDKELSKLIKDYEEAQADCIGLKEKVDRTGGGVTNTSGVEAEFDTIKQMAKMTCGRQGNHFPILTRDYFHSSPRELGTRENVIETLRWIESIDIEVYCRIYRSQLNRIPPFVILIPTYGDIGFCWEPFDRYNRITSRGRIAIPMYPRNLKVAVLTAVADLRWQVAKEKASYYWMEEGLTGNYYQWFQSQKLKGDVKEFFINDYLEWILKESDGIQKLDKTVRNVFWRYMPFAQEIKDKLKNRALVYQELCQRDRNRELSDGY